MCRAVVIYYAFVASHTYATKLYSAIIERFYIIVTTTITLSLQ